jgi:hypothetical protein
MKQRFMTRTFLFFLVFTFLMASPSLGVSAEKAPTPSPKKRQNREAYREELGRLLDANHVACSSDGDCEAIGIGAMACGGPSEFLPASKATVAKIQTAVTDLTKVIQEMDQAQNKENSMLGICLALAKPEVKCQTGKCAAKK